MSGEQTLKLEDCINETCPWSGKPVKADSLTLYRGRVVGFCNTGCRDKFRVAIALFDGKIDETKSSLG
ncbi:MAG: glutathione S-transferase [Rhodomicrobium sp.]|nr:glutathione S-transferase [Rhodomicrobium sp.]